MEKMKLASSHVGFYYYGGALVNQEVLTMVKQVQSAKTHRKKSGQEHDPEVVELARHMQRFASEELGYPPDAAKRLETSILRIYG